jgi:predicted outer membrane protein
MYETADCALENQLIATHRKLADTELEIEKVKQQLDIEKTNNSQLVQWKAKNLKTVDNLKQQLKALAGIGDVNIAALLERLSERHAELDALREEGDEFDRIVKERVHGTMHQLGAVRGRIQATQRAKLVYLQTLCRQGVTALVQSIDLGQIKGENSQLRRSNLALEAEIQELESRKDRRPVAVRGFMEATIVPPPPSISSRVKAPGIVIRPVVLNKTPSKT